MPTVKPPQLSTQPAPVPGGVTSQGAPLQGSALQGFVVFEGIDGAGTTTQLHRLALRLEERSLEVHRTFEPSGLPVGALVRRYIRKELPVLAPDALALLFAADRLDHIQSEVLPALAANRLVLCDRYVGSSLAYQGLLSNADWLATINGYAPEPQLVLYIRVDADVALDRIQARDGDRRELFEERDTLRRVVAAYDALYLNGSRPAVVIDGHAPPDAVEAEVWQAVLAAQLTS